MKILELIHDTDHPEFTNIDSWVNENAGFETKKMLMYSNFTEPGIESFDLLLIHGGAQHIWDKESDPWLKDEIRFVKEAIYNNKPVIGFCLGCQLIAEILGGKVYRAEEKEIGFYKVSPRETFERHTLLKGLETGFTSFMWHSDHFELPPECISLGFTIAAENQIIAAESFPVVGFQFHPEYTKAVISGYCQTYYEQEWKGGGYVAEKESFLEELESMPETYPLFKRLMENVLEHYKKEFGISLQKYLNEVNYYGKNV